jgi:hypothetical protein
MNQSVRIDSPKAAAPGWLKLIRAREQERRVSRVNKIHSALKHGAYTATAVLPGENLAAFQKLRQALILECSPTGPLEEDTVETLARLLWRKQNLATIRNAELARSRYSAIRSAKLPSEPYPIGMLGMFEIDPAQYDEAMRAAEHQAREELGDTYKLVEIGETATFDRLEKDLAIEERLDSVIDRCLKRLLFLRGLKSISTASSSSAPQRRIAGPGRAA